MKLEEGMYIRTDYGKIGKIIYFEGTMAKTDNEKIITFRDFNEEIKKASHNIIDLIEEGDYVNGKLVTKTNSIFPINNSIYIECYCEMNGTSLCWCYSNEEIKTIVTKEQFESMQYEVE